MVKSHEKFAKAHEKQCKTYRFTPKSLNFYDFRAAKSGGKVRF